LIGALDATSFEAAAMTTARRNEISGLLECIDKAIMQAEHLGLTTVTYVLEIAA
jgi:hypothetical protein